MKGRKVMRKTIFMLILTGALTFAAKIDSTSNIGYCVMPAVYVAEGVAFCLVGNLVGWGIPFVIDRATGYESPPGTIRPNWTVYLYPVLYPTTGALGLHRMGKILRHPGSFLGALGGGLIGVAGLLILWRSGIDWDNDSAVAFGIGALLTVPPLLSVTGHNVFAGPRNLQNSGSPAVEQNVRAACRDTFGAPKIALQVLKVTF